MFPLSSDFGGVGATGAGQQTAFTTDGADPSSELLDDALATAFYPFAKVSLRESRRQVEASQEFLEQQAARREERRDEARDAFIDAEGALRGQLEAPAESERTGLSLIPDEDADEGPAPARMPESDEPPGPDGGLDVLA